MTDQQISPLADQFSRLALVARALTGRVQPAEVIEIVVRQGMAGLSSEGGVLALLEGDEVVPAATVGYPPEVVAAFSPMTLDLDLPLTTAIRERRPIWLSSRAEAAERFPQLVANPASTSQAWVAIPLVAGGAVLGALGVSFLAPRRFVDTERIFMRALADQCAIALARLAAEGVELRERPGLMPGPRGRSRSTEPRRDRDALLWSVINASPDGVLLVDGNGRVVLANRQAERMFRYGRAELLGISLEALLPVDRREAHVLHRSRYERDPRPRAMGEMGAVTALRRDGTPLEVEVSLSPLRSGSAHLVLATVRAAGPPAGSDHADPSSPAAAPSD